MLQTPPHLKYYNVFITLQGVTDVVQRRKN
jgi:hypothetical protein